MIVALVILIILLTLIVLPIPIRFNGDIDVFQNDGWFKVFVMGVRIARTEAYFRHIDAIHNNLVFHSKRREYELHLNADKKDKRSIIQLFNVDFLPYFQIQTIDLGLNIGKRDDAFFTTLTVGGLRSITYAVFAVIKSYQSVIITESFVPVYNKDELTIRFDSIINVSVADIIFSLWLYLLKKLQK